jgi:hypothetical protein
MSLFKKNNEVVKMETIAYEIQYEQMDAYYGVKCTTTWLFTPEGKEKFWRAHKELRAHPYVSDMRVNRVVLLVRDDGSKVVQKREKLVQVKN